jgi:chromate reductase, NAD(P)H dehydrogenase (quinone)
MNPRLLLLPGSPRRESFNARLLQHLRPRLQAGCTIDWLAPSEVDLPLFNQDLESDPNVVARVAAVHRRLVACDALVVASPEYNGQVSPYLKNLVDWVSRLSRVNERFGQAFSGRAVLLCSASTGWSGGAVGIPHARALFGYVGCMVLGETICVARAGQLWQSDRYVFDPQFDAHMSRCTERISAQARGFAAERLSAPGEALP